MDHVKALLVVITDLKKSMITLDNLGLVGAAAYVDMAIFLAARGLPNSSNLELNLDVTHLDFSMLDAMITTTFHCQAGKVAADKKGIAAGARISHGENI